MFRLFCYFRISISRKQFDKGTLCLKLSFRALSYTFVFAFCWVFGIIRILIIWANSSYQGKVLEYIHLPLSIAQPFWINLVFIPSEGLIHQWGCYDLCRKCKEYCKKEVEKKKENRNPLL